MAQVVTVAMVLTTDNQVVAVAVLVVAVLAVPLQVMSLVMAVVAHLVPSISTYTHWHHKEKAFN